MVVLYQLKALVHSKDARLQIYHFRQPFMTLAIYHYRPTQRRMVTADPKVLPLL